MAIDRMGPNDWRSASPTVTGGNIFVQDVNIAGATGSVTIDVAAGDFSGLGNADAVAYTSATGSADGTLVAIGKGEYVQLRALNAAVGTIASPAYTDDTGAADGTVIGLLKGCFVQLAAINAKTV